MRNKVKTDSSKQDPQTRDITLRPVQPEDTSFLFQVYASTRASEMALVSWSDDLRHAFVSSQFAAQRDFYQQKYPHAEHNIILSNGRPVGRLFLARLDDQLRIVDITILPEERNSGIGTTLLNELLDESRRCGKPVRIYVENFNPSLRLFERLGFRQLEEQGAHLLLQWSLKSQTPQREIEILKADPSEPSGKER
jgi:RimJ/RimL family protein N-acetyltransferase